MILPPLHAIGCHLIKPWSQPIYDEKIRLVTGERLSIGTSGVITAVAAGILAALAFGGLSSFSGIAIVTFTVAVLTAPVITFLFLTAIKGYRYVWARQHVPLFEAAGQENWTGIRDALKVNPLLDINYIDGDGRVPLHYVCRSRVEGKLELLAELFKKKPNLMVKDPYENTPLGLLQKQEMEWLRAHLLTKDNLEPLWEVNQGRIAVPLDRGGEVYVLLFIVRLDDAALCNQYVTYLRTVSDVKIDELTAKINKIYEAQGLQRPFPVDATTSIN